MSTSFVDTLGHCETPAYAIRCNRHVQTLQVGSTRSIGIAAVEIFGTRHAWERDAPRGAMCSRSIRVCLHTVIQSPGNALRCGYNRKRGDATTMGNIVDLEQETWKLDL